MFCKRWFKREIFVLTQVHQARNYSWRSIKAKIPQNSKSNYRLASLAIAASCGLGYYYFTGSFSFLDSRFENDRFNSISEVDGYFSYKPSDEDDENKPLKDTKSNSLLKTFGPYTIADAVEKASPGLVNIVSKISGPFGQVGASSGSGFVFDSEHRLVATNYHVIQQSINDTLMVTLGNGDQYPGIVHSFDPLTDLAIVEVLRDPTNSGSQKHGFFHWGRKDDEIGFSEKLPSIELGSSASLRPGEWVIALGSPLNMHNTVTAGIVSSVRRDASELGMAQRRTDYIQTDAAINQGNSGGPLINLEGKVVGINTMKVANTGGIGFAIPIDTAKIVLNQLKEKKRVDRPFLGLRMAAVREIKGRHNEVGAKRGVLITNVAKGSPAHQAGIQPGEIIVSIDSIPTKTTYDVIKIIGYDIGVSHQFEVFTKDGRKRNVSITSVAANL